MGRESGTMEVNAIGSGVKRRNSLPSSVIISIQRKTSPPIFPHSRHLILHHHSSPSPAAESSDFELLPLKSPTAVSYTSLKDLLPSSPSSILSPSPAASSAAVFFTTTASSGSGFEISIRNRLVKQAAWAYLQPAVVSSPSSSSRRICISAAFLRLMIARLRRYIVETATCVYDWLVDAFWLILCR